MQLELRNGSIAVIDTEKPTVHPVCCTLAIAFSDGGGRVKVELTPQQAIRLSDALEARAAAAGHLPIPGCGGKEMMPTKMGDPL